MKCRRTEILFWTELLSHQRCANTQANRWLHRLLHSLSLSLFLSLALSALLVSTHTKSVVPLCTAYPYPPANQYFCLSRDLSIHNAGIKCGMFVNHHGPIPCECVYGWISVRRHKKIRSHSVRWDEMKKKRQQRQQQQQKQHRLRQWLRWISLIKNWARERDRELRAKPSQKTEIPVKWLNISDIHHRVAICKIFDVFHGFILRFRACFATDTHSHSHAHIKSRFVTFGCFFLRWCFGMHQH